MGDGKRLALVIGSQCQDKGDDGRLTCLPWTKGPVDLAKSGKAERLLVDLMDLLVMEGCGECDPVSHVEGVSAPGLLLNPTAAQAKAALVTAMAAAHDAKAVLVVHVLAHGRGVQRSPGDRIHHLIHLWDTVANPLDTQPESQAWDPYADIDGRREYCRGMAGLVLVMDTCQASWAKAGIDAWSGVRGGLVSAVLAASRDEAAWDACLTTTVIRVLKSGLTKEAHPLEVLVSELGPTDILPLVRAQCPDQEPGLTGHNYENRVLYLGRNKVAGQLSSRLGLDEATKEVVLRLTSHFVYDDLAEVVDTVLAHRVVAVVGGPGSGKSTLAAALRCPPRGWNGGYGLVYAAGFAATASGTTELARTLRTQLDRVPGFEEAAQRFKQDNGLRWDTLDVWQRDLIGPLTLFGQPTRILIDGMDQFDGMDELDPADYQALLHALTELLSKTTDVSLVLLGRSAPPIPGAVQVQMPGLSDEAARRYLASRGVDVAEHDRLIATADGRWLVLELAAGAASDDAATSDQMFYRSIVDRVRSREGPLVDAVLELLVASGTGPSLPLAVLEEALRELGERIERADLVRLLGDPDLYRLLERSRPGTGDDRVGLFHKTVSEHICGPSDRSRAPKAIAAALERLAPARGHDPKSFREQPLMSYAFDTLARYHSDAGEPEMVVATLAYRNDIVPGHNLARWINWSPSLREALGPDHPDALTVRSHIAYWTGSSGDAQGAVSLFGALLPDRTRVLGPRHPDTLETRNDIAAWTGVAGDARRALALFKELLPDVVDELGIDDPNTLRTRSNIGYWTGQAGDPRGARNYYQELLPTALQALGPDDPVTLRIRSNLGYWTGHAGNPGAALAQFVSLVPDVLRIKGPNSSDTLNARSNLAYWTGAVGDARSALSQFENLLPEFLYYVGAGKPGTLATRNNIAVWAGRAGDPTRALGLLRALLPDVVEVLGAKHPETLKTRGNVASWTARTGGVTEALDLLHELLADQARLVGPTHPDTLETRSNIAYWTEQAGDDRLALSLLRELWPYQVKVFGADHPDALATEESIRAIEQRRRQ